MYIFTTSLIVLALVSDWLDHLYVHHTFFTTADLRDDPGRPLDATNTGERQTIAIVTCFRLQSHRPRSEVEVKQAHRPVDETTVNNAVEEPSEGAHRRGVGEGGPQRVLVL